MARREGGIISRERFAKETSGRERNWHSWPSRWLMLRASFLLASFRVIDIPSLPLGGSWWPLTIESLNHASARASYTRRRRGRRGGFWRREKNFSTLFTRFFSIREKELSSNSSFFFSFFLSWWKGKFFLKVLVTWPNTSVETAFVFVSRSFLLYFFIVRF